jgi:hypothetical protein
MDSAGQTGFCLSQSGKADAVDHGFAVRTLSVCYRVPRDLETIPGDKGFTA